MSFLMIAAAVVTTAAEPPKTQVYALAEEDAAALFGLAGPLGGNGRPVPVAETWSEARWRVEVAGQIVRDEANPYGWIPYVIAPNGTRPGRGGVWARATSSISTTRAGS